MAIKFRVYKQLLLDTERIWVARLDENDVIDEFDTLESVNWS